MTVLDRYKQIEDSVRGFWKNLYSNFYGKSNHIYDLTNDYVTKSIELKNTADKDSVYNEYREAAAALRDHNHIYTVNRRYIWSNGKRNSIINHSRLMRNSIYISTLENKK